MADISLSEGNLCGFVRPGVHLMKIAESCKGHYVLLADVPTKLDFSVRGWSC